MKSGSRSCRSAVGTRRCTCSASARGRPAHGRPRSPRCAHVGRGPLSTAASCGRRMPVRVALAAGPRARGRTRGWRSCWATVRWPSRSTSLRRLLLIRFPPMTSRSSAVGWISTTSVPACAQLLGLAAEAPARGRAHERRARPRRGARRADRVQRRRRVEADHEVEALVAQHVEVRGRAHAAVDVAAPGDRRRAVEARDRARGGDRVGELGGAARRRGRTRRACRSRSRRPSTQRPGAGHQPSRDDAADVSCSGSVEMMPARQPAAHQRARACGGAGCAGCAAQPPRPGADRRAAP